MCTKMSVQHPQPQNPNHVSGSSSGAASRHKMLIDADKEELVAMFNEKFNKELPGFKSIMYFNSWVNKVDVEGW